MAEDGWEFGVNGSDGVGERAFGGFGTGGIESFEGCSKLKAKIIYAIW